ncbi:unnamed protein product [Didymodactylos carnosus]|uniref:Uncharacterized protein n=1 Tax=Didymodactylos carnosus TaxID=1234261 RepID=A0A814Q955_9BILA|nr:unnamed protein product [Didymodactylos carnosus]CAF1116359.1 unnamed protein product [Didymodactylos carnosus]CAF3729022.1 unnamed protein product [Didymodactylos carnosus]CAF3880170.1 unnamed protein product [Didymodactylos carnosus]
MYSRRLSANTNVGTIASLLSSDTLSNFINDDTTTSLTCKNNCSCGQHLNQYAYSDSDCLGSYGAYDNCYYQRYISSLNEQQQSHTTKCINMITDKNINNSTTHVPTVIQDATKHVNSEQQQQLYGILFTSITKYLIRHRQQLLKRRIS